jgi:hypothetical protein
MITSTEVFDEAALAALIAAAPILGNTLKAGLFTNIPVISKTTVLGDLTEATYPGYARQLVVMGPVYRDPANGIASNSNLLNWQQVGVPVATIIRGIFYIDGAGPSLAFVEAFPTPIALNDVVDAFQTVLEYIQSSQFQGFNTILR